MKIYRFFNPSVFGPGKCVIVLSDNNMNALRAFVERYYPDCCGVHLSKDFHRENVIIMEASTEPLCDGKVIFSKIFAIEIS